jgi:SAM-dependent methyltransferase
MNKRLKAVNLAGTDHPNVVVDAFVQGELAKTCGIMYKCLINKLAVYPIPELPLPEGEGQYFLDIGCNWGRWCIAAGRKKYTPVGIDPSLEALKAARRVARQLKTDSYYVVADAKHLPFVPDSFDVVFSYSVLQHFDKKDTRLALAEVRRVLGKDGFSMIQMPNMFGVRNVYNQLKRGFKEIKFFGVRYWRPSELINVFGAFIGPSSLRVDGYFSLNPRSEHKAILPLRYRFILSCSDALRMASEKIKCLRGVADSFYVESRKAKENGDG